MIQLRHVPDLLHRWLKPNAPLSGQRLHNCAGVSGACPRGFRRFAADAVRDERE